MSRPVKFLAVIGVLCMMVFESNSTINTFDPQSLYKFFKNQREKRSSDTAYISGEPGIGYFTHVSEELMKNGTISKDKVIDYYRSLTNDDKENLNDAQKKIRDCWNNAKSDGQSAQNSYEYCYFQGFGDWFWRPQCYSTYEYESLVKGDTHLKLISCLAQNQEGITNTLAKTAGKDKRSIANHGLHIEAGGGIAFGLYASGSNGVGFSLNSPSSNNLATYTYCLGFKFDVSVGGGFSVSYMLDMDDILGEALTIELGVDIPGTEAGIDLLLHFSLGTHGKIQKFIGFGFSLGIGVGLNPIDVASSYCNTKLVAQYKNSVLIAIGSYWGWVCNQRYLGVVSEGRYICCPENNPRHSCSTGYCWFDGTECPHTPQQIAQSTGFLKNAILHSSCPGQTYIPAGQGNRDKCLDLWKQDWKQKYVYYRRDSGECWFSNTYSIDTCVWAPSPTGYDIYFRPRL